MAKNKKKKSNLKPTSPVKVILPVVIGLVVVLVIAVVLAVATTPKSSAKVDNPKSTYLSVGKLNVTNQEMYESLRANNGLSSMTQIVDTELLKDVEVSDELYQEVYNKTVYGDDIVKAEKTIAEKEEELKNLTGLKATLLAEEIAQLKEDNEKAKAKNLTSFMFNAKLLGLTTDAEIKEYVTLLAKRKAYAKAEYAKWVKDGNDYDDDAYLKKFKEKDTANEYDTKSVVIAIKFASNDQAKAYLALLSNPVYTGKLTDGWMSVNEQLEIDTLNDEKATLKKDISDLTGVTQELEENKTALEEELALIDEADQEARNAKQAEIDAVSVELNNKLQEKTEKEGRVAEIENEVEGKQEASLMSDKDIVLNFIELYNIYYAYFLRGDVSTYFEDGALKDEFKLLKENVHYTVNGDYVSFDIEALRTLEKENGYARFEFTSTELSSLFGSAISSLELLPVQAEEPEEPKEGEEAEEAKRVKFYTFAPQSGSNSSYYVALKVQTTEGLEKSELQQLVDELKDAAVERKAEIEARIKEIKASLIDEMIEENYDADFETKFLLLLRQNNGLKIYDRFLNATYKAAYDYLFDKTLSETDYPEYASDAGTSKKLAFTFNKVNGEKVEYSAQLFFEYLQNINITSAIASLLNQYAVLNNEQYNKVYNPYTKKVYDKEKFNSYLTSDYNTIYTGLYSGQIKSVKAFKFAFENDLFSSYGFTKKYGWKNFLSDYLTAKDEKFLAASLTQSDAEQNYYLSTYKDADIQKEVKAIYDKYYSMKVLNMVISTDYNLDGSPDAYNLKGTQQYFTEYQEGLVQELANLFYDAEILSTVTGDTIEAKVKEVGKLYKNATFQDPTWGKYIAAGLQAKVEDSTTYSSSSSLVQEFHDEMVKIYNEIEELEDHKLGEWTDEEKNEGYIYEPVFTTQYGYHRVTILGADERVYVDDEKSLDLTKLTIELYKSYQENKDGLSEKVQKAVETYLTPAISNLGTTNAQNLLKQTLRLQASEGISFASSSIKAKYEAFEKDYTEYINALIAADEK